MNSILAALGLLTALPSANAAKLIKVAVIDTGVKNEHSYLCEDGHQDFTNTSIEDRDGHGDNISSLIDTSASTTGYCQIILKFHDPKVPTSGADNVERMKMAINRAIDLKVDIINISAGGAGFYEDEFYLVRKALDQGIIIVAAAGNNGEDLGNNCNYFPACYDSRITVVGNGENQAKRHRTSNYGRTIDVWVDSVKYSPFMVGTSQSTAVVTGLTVKTLQTK